VTDEPDRHRLYEIAIEARDLRRGLNLDAAAALYAELAAAELAHPRILVGISVRHWNLDMADVAVRADSVRLDPAFAGRLLRVAARYGGTNDFQNLVRWAAWLDSVGERDAALDVVESLARQTDGPNSWYQKDPMLAGLAGEPRFRAAFGGPSPQEVTVWVAAFERHRMAGRPLPADLRAMLTWFRSSTVADQWPLDRVSFPRPEHDPFEGVATGQEPWEVAHRAVLPHLIPVAYVEDYVAVCYWVHPDEPADRLPPIVGVRHGPLEYEVLGTGRQLADVLVHLTLSRDEDEDEDEEMATQRAEDLVAVTEGLRARGIEISPEWPELNGVVVDPQELFKRTYRELTGEDPPG